MRNLHTLDHLRLRSAEVLKRFGSYGNHGNGCFAVPSPTDSAEMFVLASDGAGWDHVSVSRGNRCPNWPEMEHVKRLFFEDSETAMQLHVPVSQHISVHPYCLHIWRPHLVPIPLPPDWTVA